MRSSRINVNTRLADHIIGAAGAMPSHDSVTKACVQAIRCRQQLGAHPGGMQVSQMQVVLVGGYRKGMPIGDAHVQHHEPVHQQVCYSHVPRVRVVAMHPACTCLISTADVTLTTICAEQRHSAVGPMVCWHLHCCRAERHSDKPGRTAMHRHPRQPGSGALPPPE